MKNRRLIFALCLCLFSQAVHAVEVQEVISKEGVKAWLVEEHAVPLVAVRMVFTDSGYAQDAPGKEGRANLAAALLTEGAGDMDARAFNEAMESRAISLEAGVDEDLFTITMETLSEHRAEAFSYLGLVLNKPRLDEQSIERSRRQALSILAQQQQQPGYMLWRAWQQKAFAGHPYSQPPVGTKESIGKLNREDIASFYARHFARQNMLIAVVGDVTAQQLSELLDAQLAPLPVEFKAEQEVKPASVAEWKTPLFVPFAMPQSMVMFGLPGVPRKDKDFFNAYVLNQLLAGGGSLTSKLGKELREKRGLTYGISANLDLAKYCPVWRGTFSTRAEQTKEALDLLQSTLRQVATGGVTQQELDDAKQYITGSFVLGLDSNADVARYLISMQMYGLGQDYFARRNQLVEVVTLEDVNALAAKMLTMDALRVAIIGKQAP